MKIVVANWKLNPQNIKEARSLAVKIEQGLLNVRSSGTETVICPPFVYLNVVQNSLHFAKLGAQDISHETKGAFTGEISGKQLKEFGVEYVIVGHSERRNLGEDDKLINAKIRSALKAGIHPILCVGFGTKKSHSTGQIKNIIKQQVKKGLKGVKGAKVVIAYEPVWAISKGLGTGKAATPEHAEEISKFIKSITEGARVLYGGSVDGKNASSFARVGIKGALVGGSSLVPAEFLKIVSGFS